MMFRFLPWKLIVRRAARSYGIADPALWLARIRNFSQPSEVQEPIELLRAGVHFHARGLINTKAIQHNLDWVWPYWVERQFDPADDSFIPRAFSFSHINLTHRNWTAVGLPELALLPIVDPRGLVTPLQDGWSLDFWLIDDSGHTLIPSRVPDKDCDQSLICGQECTVQTSLTHNDQHLEQRTDVVVEDNQPVLRIRIAVRCAEPGSLVMLVRPYNPEGVQFVDRVEALPRGRGWLVNDQTKVFTDVSANRLVTSHYDEGDVLYRLHGSGQTRAEIADPEVNAEQPMVHESAQLTEAAAIREDCDQGMATAASVFDFAAGRFELTVRVPLQSELQQLSGHHRFDPRVTWNSVLADSATLHVPDARIQQLYSAAVHTLVLLSVQEVVPGPYTYRRFWFRDACLMMHPLMSLGFTDRCLRTLLQFPERQLRNGYFRSQDGEWDSNGQVLWILNRYRLLTHSPLPDPLYRTLDKAVRWIERKRLPNNLKERHAGLLPAGFSAEHLGPNDFYYWDDFWAEAGLLASADIWTDAGETQKAAHARQLASEMRAAIERSLQNLPESRTAGGIPASPYRRMDSGAIGSLVADYPLQLAPADDPRIAATVEALLGRHFYRGGFMQDMIHSGINAYLTLDIAQTLLRHQDPRYRKLVDAVAQLASPTGQWPEAIHPRTLGGCMGDGQHGWAAAEWVMMIRNCFVREEPDRLVIGSGLFREWFDQDSDLAFGPTLTAWGRVSIRVIQPHTQPRVVVDCHWHGPVPPVDLLIPGFEPVRSANVTESVPLTRLLEEEFRVDA